MFKSAAPGLSVNDLAQAITFYEEKLGFSKVYGNEGYAVMQRDAVAIHLSPDREKAGKCFCTLFVSGVDSIYAALASNGVTVKRPLEQSPYGMKDFVILDLDGNTILIGEPSA